MDNKNVSDDILLLARKVRLLLMDCDGVMTDGRLYFSAEGEAMKVFHVRDGHGLAMWHQAGFRSGIITGRDAGQIINIRAAELGTHYVRVKSSDKVRDFREIIADAGLVSDQIAFVGDDIGDVGLMRQAGFSVAVADAVEEVRAAAHFVTQANGGFGAIREVTDLLLQSRKTS